MPSVGTKAGTNAIAAPTDDKRWRVVDATMRRHGYRPAALIEALHSVQESFGCLDEPGLQYVAASLGVPLSRVFGVATFYHYFSLKPQGDHTCVVCTGTACYIKESPALLRAIEAEFGIANGETTPDGSLSLLTARCLGTCGLAPAAVLDGDVAGRLQPAELLERLHQLVGAAKEVAAR
ncbi:MAG: bidirectional hydrogenase complex protein HoxE [Chloroflexi bacterium]|nr:bidirectional hydrogenase complex protein HoxE [Chloroflexota bacterium]